MEDKNITVISDQANEANNTLAGSSMTKAGRLAMELSHEKKRLKQELEELQDLVLQEELLSVISRLLQARIEKTR